MLFRSLTNSPYSMWSHGKKNDTRHAHKKSEGSRSIFKVSPWRDHEELSKSPIVGVKLALICLSPWRASWRAPFYTLLCFLLCRG